MFFCISDSDKPITQPFQRQYKLNQFFVFLDHGWHCHEDILFKGYCLEQELINKVKNKNFSEENGNYCILDFSDNNCKIYHDNSRSFPMYYNKNIATNVQSGYLTPVHYDGAIHFNKEWTWLHKPENKFFYNSDHKKYNKNQIVDMYCNYLIETCKKINTNLPIFCALTQGVDTTAIRSAMDYCGINYELVKISQRTKAELGWGYRQLYVEQFPHLQVTGFCGDELLLRNPMYCQWLLDSENISLISEFNKLEHSYMKNFFNKKYKEKIYNRNEKFNDKEQAFNYTSNVIVNDFQMWHTDNTITFTPYRNIPIAIECLYADIDAILDQVIHAGISKAIIKRLNPDLLKNISKNKNEYE